MLSGLADSRTYAKITPSSYSASHESDEYFFRALEAGAAGYVLKKAVSEDLVDAVHAVARGEAFLYPSMARKLVNDYLRRAGAGETSGYNVLSDREREVLLLITQGLTNQQIAERLTISPSTVQTHRTHIMEKLGWRTTAELVRYAVRSGLIEP